MRTYELVLVIRPSVKEADRKKLFEQIKEWLGKDVKVAKADDWGQKALAYPIKKEEAGHYSMWQLEGEGYPSDFEQRLIRNDSIIRHLMLRTK
ncbi:MAG: 30S ribosomal protein S6 [Candidatus Levyibacteriota bacterium]